MNSPLNIMVTEDLVEIEVFKNEDGTSYLELDDIEDPTGYGTYAILMTKADRKHLIAILTEVDN
jgi:hypothetical protein